MSQKDLMKRHGIKADRRLGQNFLVNQQSLERIIAAAELTSDMSVLEIGAGLGALTVLLAQSCRRVVTIEIDRRILPALEEQIAPYHNVQLVQADALEVDLHDLMGDETYIVVANIPYYITSALIRKLLEAANPAERVILTIQKEVARRIIARDGKMSLLSLGVQLYGEAHIEGRIPASHFYPAPKVESAVLSIDLHSQMDLTREEISAVFKLARAGFSQKRKQLRNSVAGGLGISSDEAAALLEAGGIDPSRRAETVSVDEWKHLACVWRSQS